MKIDTTKEREKLEKLFDDIETQFLTPRKVNLENHLGNLGGAVKRYCTALDVIDAQAAEIERLKEGNEDVLPAGDYLEGFEEGFSAAKAAQAAEIESLWKTINIQASQIDNLVEACAKSYQALAGTEEPQTAIETIIEALGGMVREDLSEWVGLEIKGD